MIVHVTCWYVLQTDGIKVWSRRIVCVCVCVQVSEGLVQVSDPPLHGRGNFLDSQVELDRRLLDYIVGLDTEISELVDGSVSNSYLLCHDTLCRN